MNGFQPDTALLDRVNELINTIGAGGIETRPPVPVTPPQPIVEPGPELAPKPKPQDGSFEPPSFEGGPDRDPFIVPPDQQPVGPPAVAQAGMGGAVKAVALIGIALWLLNSGNSKAMPA